MNKTTWRFGVADEAYKYCTGLVADTSRRLHRNFPGRLWDTYPDLNPVPGGRDLFDSQQIDLLAAQNDWVAFQLGITADTPFLLSRTNGMTLSPRQGVATLRLAPWCDGPNMQPQLSFEGLVRDNDRYRKADLLSRRESQSYDAYAVGMVWAEVAIPEATPPGTYHGGIRLYESVGLSDERLVGEVTFSVEVYDVRLPGPQETNFELDLWQHNCTLARAYGVERYSEEHFALLEPYVKSLAALGENCVTVIAGDIPWCGQSCHRLEDGSDLYEYSMVNIVRDKNGCFHYDFSRMQRYIDLCFAHGIDRWIRVFGLVSVCADPEYGMDALAPDHPDCLRIRYVDETDGCAHLMRNGADIDAYIRALERYFIDNGLMDKVLLSADEPMDHDYYEAIIARINRIAPSFRFFAAINHTEHVRQCSDNTDSFCLILPAVSEEWDALCDLRRTTDKIYTWYVCCGPAYPNTFLRSHLLETRAIGALTAFFRLDGFLRWAYTAWNPNPQESLCWHHFPAGDNSFVYPGEDGKPLLSLRYKQLKRAMEDYRLMEQLRRRLGERAEPILQRVWEQLFRTQDPRRLAACDQTAEAVFHLDYEAFNRAKAMLLKALAENKED